MKEAYIWSNAQFELPIKIRHGFTFKKPGEIHPAFSLNKKHWGHGSDALSWFMATMRQDFTFRTKLFGEFPASVREHSGFKCKVNQHYIMECFIYPDRA